MHCVGKQQARLNYSGSFQVAFHWLYMPPTYANVTLQFVLLSLNANPIVAILPRWARINHDSIVMSSI